MSYEDRCCEESFQVESSSDFLNGLDEEEIDFLFNRSTMKVCNNCGEFVSKLNHGICNLCAKSQDHQEIRGSRSQANNNMGANIDFIKRFNERY